MTHPRFQPFSFSWVALHPEARGVIQFIGGAFFGTFPTFFYHQLLQELYQEKYTLVVLPFRFSLHHWSIANSLLNEHNRLRQSLPNFAKRHGYEPSLYQKTENYQWLGHSLGCKYIALLELLSSHEQEIKGILSKTLNEIDPNDLGILDQSSVLLAPDISDIESAIPIRPLATLLKRIGVNVSPNRKQTLDLIRQSALFNLTAVISFDADVIAGSLDDNDVNESDVLWLSQYLQTKSSFVQELSGQHLEPLGWRVGHYIADFNPFDKFIKDLRQWQVAEVAFGYLQRLHRQLVQN